MGDSRGTALDGIALNAGLLKAMVAFRHEDERFK
jgi:hypothetical protein